MNGVLKRPGSGCAGGGEDRSERVGGETGGEEELDVMGAEGIDGGGYDAEGGRLDGMSGGWCITEDNRGVEVRERVGVEEGAEERGRGTVD